MPAEFLLRLASLSDRKTIAAMLEEARAWLAERGIDQWNRPFDDAWISLKLDAGEFFIAERNGDAVGVVRLLDEDRPFWGDRDRGDSLYIHSLATCRDLAGQQLGAQILAEIATLARARNRSTLRLDCVAANPRLIAYYASHGFAPVDTITLGDFEMVLMERSLLPDVRAAMPGTEVQC